MGAVPKIKYSKMTSEGMVALVTFQNPTGVIKLVSTFSAEQMSPSLRCLRIHTSTRPNVNTIQESENHKCHESFVGAVPKVNYSKMTSQRMVALVIHIHKCNQNVARPNVNTIQ